MSVASETVFCPIYQKDIDLDLCRETQMVAGSEYVSEFVPEIMEQELAPEHIRQCQACPLNTLSAA